VLTGCALVHIDITAKSFKACPSTVAVKPIHLINAAAIVNTRITGAFIKVHFAGFTKKTRDAPAVVRTIRVLTRSSVQARRCQGFAFININLTMFSFVPSP